MSEQTAVTPVPAVKEKIIFEVKTLMLPTILNAENLVTIGFVAIAMIAWYSFHLGLQEMLLLALLFLILAVPSFRSIFEAGSTTYVLTNQRLIIFSVGIRQKERSIPLASIANVETKSSGLQFLYGAGDILVRQKGFRRSIKMRGLKGCKHYADMIIQAMKKK